MLHVVQGLDVALGTEHDGFGGGGGGGRTVNPMEGIGGREIVCACGWAGTTTKMGIPEDPCGIAGDTEGLCLSIAGDGEGLGFGARRGNFGSDGSS